MKRLAWPGFALGCALLAVLLFSRASTTVARGPHRLSQRAARPAPVRSDGFESANWAAPVQNEAREAPDERLAAPDSETEAPKLPEGLKGVPVVLPAPEGKR